MNETLENIRSQIDQLDDEIIQLLAKRFILCKKTSKFKKQAEDLEREKKIFTKISSPYIQHIYREIIFQAKQFQGKEDDF
ncbi:MAG: chorismate mutase [Parachlamydiales bacterium]|nr:chorismate mutase [Parachlamydiales bacterium]